MGTILASAVIADASELLQDRNNVRWTAPRMLKWLNAGLRELVVGEPSACVRNENVALVAGTKQALPIGGILLMDVTRNMGVGGATPGRVPRFIKRQVIDAQNPNWHNDTANATVLHYIYDERDPNVFYVYPKQPATNRGVLEMIFSAAPTALTADTQPIPVDDVYANALVDYLMYRAYATDPVNKDKADSYYKSFMFLVTGKESVDAENKASESTEG